jgi:pentatricopeptide repeat protein
VENRRTDESLQLLTITEQEDTDFIRAAAYFKLKRHKEGLELLKDMVDKKNSIKIWLVWSSEYIKC